MPFSNAVFRPIERLSRATLLFPLALVLFEFATYIANDMILPAMPGVVHEFGVGDVWVPTGMSTYLAGGAALQWLLGPLSDRIGRRPVMLAGIVLFIISCLATLLVTQIGPFLVLRFVQGFGLCFVVAVAYAAVQEAFAESAAIRVTALMANVALIAPLIGPLLGAAIITILPWRSMFVMIAIVAAIALGGIVRHMPETAPRNGGPLSIKGMWRDYSTVFGNRRFLLGVLAVALSGLPLLAWIGQSPVILMTRAGLDSLDFGVWQIPIFIALIAGNLTLARFAMRVPVRRLVGLGSIPLLAGLALNLLVLWQPHAWGWLILGLSVYAYGLGLIGAGLYRLALFSSSMSKGTVSAALGMSTLLIYSLGIELVKFGYLGFGNAWFAVFCLLAGLGFVWVKSAFLQSDAGL
ncbi:Multidrug transporter MdfA [Andreprevotia sp. IGB-42]|uniref:MFS transporter n=1 Tax=Andreprevotia sp. IGB-42 TaxID=2497473 RepID=UPI00135BE022|nr:MFS transporter [Andreprevotia sp. IGB-42]KAF0813289.1 Multidrug transporter MdfA [Andreprevotia sp. IGB-42]